jgi:hypothetical protein
MYNVVYLHYKDTLSNLKSILRGKEMKNFEVRFFNPMQPGDIGSMTISAKNEIAAILEAKSAIRNDYGMKCDIDKFLVRQTKENGMLTAQNWSTNGINLVESPVNGYKQAIYA